MGTFVDPVLNDETSLPLVDNGTLTRTTIVSGLSTVSTDVWLDLFVIHPDTSELTVTLTNPAGTIADVFVGAAGGNGEIATFRAPRLGFPGDEPANGVWTLTIVDDSAGNEGTLLDYVLRVGSRDD